MTDRKTLDQAKHWALWADRKLGIAESHAYARAAAEVIQSLPDEIIDGVNLREILKDHHPSKGGIVNMRLWESLTSLLPKPADPRKTLADMEVDELMDCEWRTAEVGGYSGECVITKIFMGGRVRLLNRANGATFGRDHDKVIPIIGAPKMQWPGEPEPEPEFDPDYLYRDKEDDVWEYINGEWVCGDTANQRKDLWELGAGVDTLSPKYSPYTRIEKRN